MVNLNRTNPDVGSSDLTDCPIQVSSVPLLDTGATCQRDSALKMLESEVEHAESLGDSIWQRHDVAN
jgi:hypothetical protein